MSKTERKNLTFEQVGGTLAPIEMIFVGSDERKYKVIIRARGSSPTVAHYCGPEAIVDGWRFVSRELSVVKLEEDGVPPISKHPGPTFMELWVEERTR